MQAKNPPKFYVIIPILNEEANLPVLFASLERLRLELQDEFDTQIILVDDGSTDNSYEAAKIMSAKIHMDILHHGKNLGPGKAFASAFSYLAEFLRPDDLVLTIEGDNTSRLEIIKKMLIRMNEGYEVILASPYQYMGGIVNTTKFRVVLSKIANVLIKELIGLNGFLTVSSFFRLHSGKSIIELQTRYGKSIIDHSGFECMIEMLAKIVSLNLTASEVPLILDTSLRKGKSKMKIIKTIVGYFSIWRDIKRMM